MAEYLVVEKDCSFDVPFACTSCGHSASAVLRVRADAAAAVGATREDERAVAERRADWVAQQNADRLRLLIPCPRCGAIDAAGLRRYRTGRLVLAGALLVPGLVALTVALQSTGSVSVIGWIFALLVPCALQPIAQAARPPKPDVEFRRAE